MYRNSLFQYERSTSPRSATPQALSANQMSEAESLSYDFHRSLTPTSVVAPSVFESFSSPSSSSPPISSTGAFRIAQHTLTARSRGSFSPSSSLRSQGGHSHSPSSVCRYGYGSSTPCSPLRTSFRSSQISTASLTHVWKRIVRLLLTTHTRAPSWRAVGVASAYYLLHIRVVGVFSALCRGFGEGAVTWSVFSERGVVEVGRGPSRG